jgi:hypothetical protein
MLKEQNMSNLRLKAIPSSLAAVGLLTLGMGAAFAADQATGVPASGVYAQGTFAPSSYAMVTKNMYASDPTLGATLTGGFIIAALKPTQTAWGYALTGSTFTPSVGSHTLTHTLTTGTNTCTVKYLVSYDPAGTMTVSYQTATSSVGTATTATSACRTAFANQTGLTAATFDGTQASKSYNLIY